jgi:HAE1 family hydrophobic/amphiphilic exporter-1
MNLPELSIRRPVFAWMLMAALLLFGAISFTRLGVSQLPDVTFPVVQAQFSLNGAAPGVMESQVLDPIEDVLMQIDGVHSVTSTAQQGSASISIEFEFGRDIDSAAQEVESRINQVKNLLPTDLYPAIIRKTNPEDLPIMFLVLTSSDPKTQPIDLMIYARDYLYDNFTAVDGVGNIFLAGYLEPELRVWLDAEKMRHFNLTSGDVLTAIQNEHSETPVGTFDNKDHEFNVRYLGEAENPAEFGKIRIQNRASQGANYRPTRLDQIATIEEGIASVRKISRFNGHLAVGMGIIKQHGSNAVDVADKVREKLKELEPLIKPPFHVEVFVDNTRFIKQSVNSLLFTLMMSVILTSAVCFLFLGSWTSTINVLLAIPTSIVGTFIALFFFGFTLNTFTLLGLSLAIGIVVDDAIMMLENIVRHRELGEKRRAAALKGAQEISFAAVAATLAVVAIFLPVVFMQGIIGRFFLQYGLTVTMAVLLSLLEALTLTPMRCSRFLNVTHHTRGFSYQIDRLFAWLSGGYANVLRVLLRSRWTKFGSLFVMLLFFASSLLIAKTLPGELMPAQDQGVILMRFKTPIGTAFEVTNGKIKEVEAYLRSLPEIEGVMGIVGGFSGNAANEGLAFVTLVDRTKRSLTQMQMMDKVRKDLAVKVTGLETVLQDMSLRGFAATRGFPVEFIVQGPDWEKLTDETKRLMDQMKKNPYLVDTNTDVQAGAPELQILPDRASLAAHAVSVGTVTGALNVMVGGEVLTGSTQYSKGRHRYAIEVRLKPDQRQTSADLKGVHVRNNRGETVPLTELVDQQVKPSLTLISRLDRQRAITVYANIAPGHSQRDAMAEVEKIAKSKLAPGYTTRMIGSSESFKKSFLSLITVLLMGVLVSYMVLGSQFNSFIHPVTVLMALPFSFSGALMGLKIAHQSINMYSLIGFILLMGIVKKNSILLVDFTNQVRTEGLDVKSALIKACPVRLRPIIMTSAATVAGALPEALSFGPGAEVAVPMAVSLIGGVIASTLLTLFIVPCVYSLLSRFESVDVLDKKPT